MVKSACIYWESADSSYTHFPVIFVSQVRQAFGTMAKLQCFCDRECTTVLGTDEEMVQYLREQL